MFGAVTAWVNDNSAQPELSGPVHCVPILSIAWRGVTDL
ncbi:hypothetical protein DIQ79_17075 [Mycolicibacterium smegmatis]|uniref:Uncharacterized protein n=1 Tax=Mycolicibacterium smegmatis (strain ATCC 700084 / mc(2)155) TaxID=246196 RepID=A0QSE8_MYCS2|nr:hypothetical protein MSMEG_1454 [Mycolicibacterium smegmatis MC2 155]TBM43956.1 hypothetical protein DIQ86_17630 [Mycolicibacterium smegmatis]TBH44713.1 hypothetical protein EYS45_16140 [Mycolicibacterium smegmatis MC2 155]TBM49998.1 hypothetical protein DIQ85_17525 [Mycolicibacterium smegmatis]TBM60696.1 hypothetical protein DIQ83_17585 [Mycolicibacterium smegmatis]